MHNSNEGRDEEGKMMTEAELKQLLMSHHWRLKMIRRYQTRYAYATKRNGRKTTGKAPYTTLSRYIATERKLHELTQDEVLRRIGVLDESPV